MRACSRFMRRRAPSPIPIPLVKAFSEKLWKVPTSGMPATAAQLSPYQPTSGTIGSWMCTRS